MLSSITIILNMHIQRQISKDVKLWAFVNHQILRHHISVTYVSLFYNESNHPRIHRDLKNDSPGKNFRTHLRADDQSILVYLKR